MSFVDLFHVLSQLVEKRNPTLAYFLSKFDKLTFYERIATLKALHKELKRNFEVKVGVIPIAKLKSFDFDKLWNSKMLETIDPIVTENELLLGVINLEGSEYSDYFCLCGGGVCASGASYPCSETTKHIDGRYACNTSNAARFYHRLAIGDGRPYSTTWYLGIPQYKYDPKREVMFIYAEITPEASFTVKSVMSCAYYYGYTSATCCDSCPAENVNTSYSTWIIPVYYWEVEVDVVGNVTYRVLVGLKAV